MFIAHGEKLRKNARWIMAGVLLLLIPGFIALFTTTGRTDRQGGDLPTIHGKPVNAVELERTMGLVQAQYIVLQGRELRKTGDVLNQIKQEAVIQLLMNRKAAELGLRVSDAELAQHVCRLPVLLNEAGQFDPERYRRLTIYLNNKGINEAVFEQVLRSQLLHEKLQQLVTTVAQATPTEVQQAYLPLHEKLTIDLVRFEMANNQTPMITSNEEVRAFYEQSKESFRTPARVKIRYATFPVADALKTIKLSDDEIAEFYDRNQFKYTDTNNVPKPLATVKAELQDELLRLRAERAAGDRATELTVKLVRQTETTKPDFNKLCDGFGVVVQETGYLTAHDKPAGLKVSAEFMQKAFSLTPDQPYSDPIAGTNAFYVLEFVDGQPSTIPAFEQVQEQAAEQVKKLRRYASTLDQARATVEQLKKLMTGGQTFAGACAELKLKIETPPPFAVADEKLDLPSAVNIQQLSLGMKVGAISDVVRTLTGGVVFSLRARQAADLAEFEKNKEQLTRQVLQRNRQALFNDWIQTLIRDEQVDFKNKPQQPEVDEPVTAN
ncbi:MAG: SurA N-terminal domain-containing protein [Verrucomicrobiota bacterium]